MLPAAPIPPPLSDTLEPLMPADDTKFTTRLPKSLDRRIAAYVKEMKASGYRSFSKNDLIVIALTEKLDRDKGKK